MNSRFLKTVLQLAALLVIAASLSSCNKPSVYGSIGVSSGYSSYGGGPRMHGSISIGGRIR
jgi:hypothetical protein